MPIGNFVFLLLEPTPRRCANLGDAGIVGPLAFGRALQLRRASDRRSSRSAAMEPSRSSSVDSTLRGGIEVGAPPAQTDAPGRRYLGTLAGGAIYAGRRHVGEGQGLRSPPGGPTEPSAAARSPAGRAPPEFSVNAAIRRARLPTAAVELSPVQAGPAKGSAWSESTGLRGQRARDSELHRRGGLLVVELHSPGPPAACRERG